MAKTDETARVALDDVISAAGQGALRALSARQLASSQNNGFYVDMHIRVGIPPAILQVVRGDQGGPIAGGGPGGIGGAGTAGIE